MSDIKPLSLLRQIPIVGEVVQTLQHQPAIVVEESHFLLRVAYDSLRAYKQQLFSSLHRSLISPASATATHSNTVLSTVLSTVLDTLQHEVFTPEFAMEIGLMTLSGAMGGFVGTAATASIKNRAFAFGLRMALTHGVSSRANEAMQMLLGHTDHVSGVSLRDLGGITNISSAEGINHLLQPVLRRFISNPLLTFAAGRIIGALTMMASTAVETKVGNVLGYSHEDWRSPFNSGQAFTRAFTRSLALDVGIHSGNALSHRSMNWIGENGSRVWKASLQSRQLLPLMAGLGSLVTFFHPNIAEAATQASVANQGWWGLVGLAALAGAVVSGKGGANPPNEFTFNNGVKRIVVWPEGIELSEHPHLESIAAAYKSNGQILFMPEIQGRPILFQRYEPTSGKWFNRDKGVDSRRAAAGNYRLKISFGIHDWLYLSIKDTPTGTEFSHASLENSFEQAGSNKRAAGAERTTVAQQETSNTETNANAEISIPRGKSIRIENWAFSENDIYFEGRRILEFDTHPHGYRLPKLKPTGGKLVKVEKVNATREGYQFENMSGFFKDFNIPSEGLYKISCGVESVYVKISSVTPEDALQSVHYIFSAVRKTLPDLRASDFPEAPHVVADPPPNSSTRKGQGFTINLSSDRKSGQLNVFDQLNPQHIFGTCGESEVKAWRELNAKARELVFLEEDVSQMQAVDTSPFAMRGLADHEKLALQVRAERIECWNTLTPELRALILSFRNRWAENEAFHFVRRILSKVKITFTTAPIRVQRPGTKGAAMQFETVGHHREYQLVTGVPLMIKSSSGNQLKVPASMDDRVHLGVQGERKVLYYLGVIPIRVTLDL